MSNRSRATTELLPWSCRMELWPPGVLEMLVVIVVKCRIFSKMFDISRLGFWGEEFSGWGGWELRWWGTGGNSNSWTYFHPENWGNDHPFGLFFVKLGWNYQLVTCYVSFCVDTVLIVVYFLRPISLNRNFIFESDYHVMICHESKSCGKCCRKYLFVLVLSVFAFCAYSFWWPNTSQISICFTDCASTTPVSQAAKQHLSFAHKKQVNTCHHLGFLSTWMDVMDGMYVLYVKVMYVLYVAEGRPWV